MPLLQEWEIAASHNGRYTPYPWKGNSITDSAGNYLANCYPIVGNYTADGALLTKKTKSYPASPNNLFDMSGNVAEITMDQSGKVVLKGGSWRSKPEEIQIYSSQKSSEFLLPNSSTGFRTVLVYEYHYSRGKYEKDYPNKK
jgi:formylglycine-generating enzyme required for sulfatase activity